MTKILTLKMTIGAALSGVILLGVAGCGGEQDTRQISGAGDRTAQKPAEKATLAVTPPKAKTKTLWTYRSKYEKEGQTVLFTDCGLYKGNTNELTGAECVYDNERWVLVDPVLEPLDNFMSNADFSGHVTIPEH